MEERGKDAWDNYREACSIAKKVVAAEKGKKYQELYDSLGTREEEKRFIRLLNKERGNRGI